MQRFFNLSFIMAYYLITMTSPYEHIFVIIWDLIVGLPDRAQDVDQENCILYVSLCLSPLVLGDIVMGHWWNS